MKKKLLNLVMALSLALGVAIVSVGLQACTLEKQSSYYSFKDTELQTSVTPARYIDMSEYENFDQSQKCFIDMNDRKCMYIPTEIGDLILEVGKTYEVTAYLNKEYAVYYIIDILKIEDK